MRCTPMLELMHLRGRQQRVRRQGSGCGPLLEREAAVHRCRHAQPAMRPRSTRVERRRPLLPDFQPPRPATASAATRAALRTPRDMAAAGRGRVGSGRVGWGRTGRGRMGWGRVGCGCTGWGGVGLIMAVPPEEAVGCPRRLVPEPLRRDGRSVASGRGHGLGSSPRSLPARRRAELTARAGAEVECRGAGKNALPARFRRFRRRPGRAARRSE
jgi:hypothetical protein